MNFLSSRIGRYLVSQTFFGVFVAFAAVTSTILLVDLVEQFRSVGANIELSLTDAVLLTLMRAPSLIEETMPFIVLTGTMIATLRLNQTSQLVAMRASGVSAWRFVLPAGLLAFVFGLIVITVLNPLGATLYGQAELRTAELESQHSETPAQNGVWIRQGDDQGQVVIHAAAIQPNGARLTDADFMFFEERAGTLKFARRIHAELAELRPGFWQLSNLVEGAAGEQPMPQQSLAIPTSLHPSELLDRFSNPESLSFWQLPAFIAETEEAGLAPVRYQMKWQGLLAYPVMLVAMALLGAVFSLRLQRLGQMAQWGGVGVAFGLLLFFMSEMAAAFAAAQAVPPFVAAWSAPLTGVFAALAVLAFLEDG